MSTRELLTGVIGKNTVWMFGGLSTRILVQAVTALLAARTLGSEQFGYFAASLAIVSVLTPFAALGTGYVLVMRVARDPAAFPLAWGRALFVLAIGCPLFTGAAVLAAALFVPGLPWTLMLTIALTELLFYQLVALAAQCFQAVQRLDRTAKIQLLVSVARLIAILIFARLASHPTALQWSRWYILSTALAGIVAAGYVMRTIGTPVFDFTDLRSDVKEGFFFAVGSSSQAVYNDIDKAMLARMASFEAAGLYAVAYRVVQTSFTPIRALANASFPVFFVRGRQGIDSSIGLAKQLLPPAFGYGAAASLALFGLSGLVPRVLGNEYAGVADAIRWLAPLPLLQSLHYFGADTLSGAGLQRIRSTIQVSVVACNVALNLWLIPLYSWQGSAWASLASDGMLAIGVWAAIYLARRWQQDTPPRLAEEAVPRR